MCQRSEFGNQRLELSNLLLYLYRSMVCCISRLHSERANNTNDQRVLRCCCDKRSHGWRSAGVEPRMGSSTEEQLECSTARTDLCVFFRACSRIGTGRIAFVLLFPPRCILHQVGRYAIHGCACRSTNAILLISDGVDRFSESLLSYSAIFSSRDLV